MFEMHMFISVYSLILLLLLLLYVTNKQEQLLCYCARDQRLAFFVKSTNRRVVVPVFCKASHPNARVSLPLMQNGTKNRQNVACAMPTEFYVPFLLLLLLLLLLIYLFIYS